MRGTFLKYTLLLLLYSPFLTAQNTRNYAHLYDPPWQQDSLSGTSFTAYGIDNLPDFHGDINHPGLVIFFAGNQYMVVPELLAAFRKQYPQYQHLFAETIPPGIEARQMTTGSLVVGNMRITLKPDIITAGQATIIARAVNNKLSDTLSYVRNKLAIMVAKGNPKKITSLSDLGRTNVRISMPNPAWEGIAIRITKAYFGLTQSTFHL